MNMMRRTNRTSHKGTTLGSAFADIHSSLYSPFGSHSLYDNLKGFVNANTLIFFAREVILGTYRKGGIMKELKVEVVEIKDRCGAKHRVGDHFFIRGEGTIEIPSSNKVCLYALNSLFPFLTAKQREDELPHDDWIAETETLCCPDPRGVVFKVSRI
jgi:uncharacterized repeat protein (TIGR04076 family)